MLVSKLLKPSGGLYLIVISTVYLIVGFIDVFVTDNNLYPAVQIGWLFLISLPLWCSPVARFLNMKEPNMFGLNKAKKELVDSIKERGSTVYDIPKVTIPNTGPAKEDAMYTIGKNESGNVQLRLALDYGSATLTMNEVGVIDLIEQLAFQIRHSHSVDVNTIAEEVKINKRRK